MARWPTGWNRSAMNSTDGETGAMTMKDDAKSSGGLRDHLLKSSEITITVTGRKSGRSISIPVWFVVEHNQLGPHLRQLVAAGFLGSYGITKAKGASGLVIAFTPGQGFYDDYDRFYRRRARSAVRAEHQPDQRETGDPLKLAYLFTEKRTGPPFLTVICLTPPTGLAFFTTMWTGPFVTVCPLLQPVISRPERASAASTPMIFRP